jgi:hypothetical protein
VPLCSCVPAFLYSCPAVLLSSCASLCPMSGRGTRTLYAWGSGFAGAAMFRDSRNGSGGCLFSGRKSGYLHLEAHTAPDATVGHSHPAAWPPPSAPAVCARSSCLAMALHSALQALGAFAAAWSPLGTARTIRGHALFRRLPIPSPNQTPSSRPPHARPTIQRAVFVVT